MPKSDWPNARGWFQLLGEVAEPSSQGAAQSMG